MLRLLLNLKMFDEAERLAMAFEERERVQPLLWVAEAILDQDAS